MEKLCYLTSSKVMGNSLDGIKVNCKVQLMRSHAVTRYNCTHNFMVKQESPEAYSLVRETYFRVL